MKITERVIIYSPRRSELPHCTLQEQIGFFSICSFEISEKLFLIYAEIRVEQRLNPLTPGVHEKVIHT